MQKVEKGGGGKALSEMSCEFKEDVYIRPFFYYFHDDNKWRFGSDVFPFQFVGFLPSI